ncbi:MAG TPA: hypothetical protein VLM75_09825 [Spirochaetota bacterium]|nr:hypothetical protein [Spirochaetota bacterium]
MTRTHLFTILCAHAAIILLSCGGDTDRALRSYIAGKEAFAKRELGTARERFVEAVRLDESLHNARLMLAKVNYYEKNFDAALVEVDRILKKDDDHIGALYWKARIQVVRPAEKSADVGAMALLSRVLELDAHHLPARSLLALLYEKNEKYREALNEYLVILAEEESLIDARANLGVLYSRLGLKAKALEELDRAISISRASGRSDTRLTSLRKEIAE